MTGLIDGSLSTLAPIFAVAFATRQPHYAFFAGLATAIGAGVSMAFSEGLSDTGDLTGRGHPYLRGKITGAGTFLGGILHTLPFLIPATTPRWPRHWPRSSSNWRPWPGSGGASSPPASSARSSPSRSEGRSSPASAPRSAQSADQPEPEIDECPIGQPTPPSEPS
jgi:hypothetical protein